MKLQIKIEGKTYEAEVEVLDDEASQTENMPDTSPSSMARPAPGAYVPAQSTLLNSADEKKYRSPVNGLVIQVNVIPGQEIQPNQVILVLEAMKMENSIVAHHAGKVKCVNVAPGNPAKLHQVLIELE